MYAAEMERNMNRLKARVSNAGYAHVSVADVYAAIGRKGASLGIERRVLAGLSAHGMGCLDPERLSSVRNGKVWIYPDATPESLDHGRALREAIEATGHTSISTAKLTLNLAGRQRGSIDAPEQMTCKYMQWGVQLTYSDNLVSASDEPVLASLTRDGRSGVVAAKTRLKLACAGGADLVDTQTVCEIAGVEFSTSPDEAKIAERLAYFGFDSVPVRYFGDDGYLLRDKYEDRW